ncbi:vWA domain-containing protein [Candidatus Laterigemmans baculatus]|uniref:vWA domain-containing protein n=1 Tax=Candidatus Laterigemmans baculatus TaxID=2770505 RepID=UPI0013D972F7|nr:vWA domain-containing protein [Candidatus Laterigemmans baculatus]
MASTYDNSVAGDPSVDALGSEEFEGAEGWVFGSDAVALLASMLAHMAVVLLLALVPLVNEPDDEAIVLVSPPPEYEVDQVQKIEEILYSDQLQDQVGANSLAAAAMAEASAPEFAEVAEIPSPVDQMPQELATIHINNVINRAVAPLDLDLTLKGKVGQTSEGATGAVDRLTFEILKALEDRPTLIVWLFDQSGSLTRQREEIRDRFDRIYEELGIVEASGSSAFQHDDEEAPLLTSIMGFGQKVELLTKQPTADLETIKKTVDSIESDPSGVEKVFSAVYAAADEYKRYRRSRATSGPERNVLLIVVTDERGDDAVGMEPTIDICKRFGMPVYVVGVPAPFGQEHTLVKYVDPDPKYDQTPQFAEVDQGPESLRPERVTIGYTGNFEREPVVDSGFGPFALTRLCYETGGIFFAVHPNRNVNRRVTRGELSPFASQIEYFVDSSVMSRYRPDYVSSKDYEALVRQSPLRSALVTAAQFTGIATLDQPETRFVRRSDAQLVGDLSRAQQAAALIEPKLAALDQLLEKGEQGREDEFSPRWLAGFDLARGRVLAHRVRAETYNAMLAQAKRGMNFADPKNNTWVLQPAAEISVGSKWERDAQEATRLLESVREKHAGTPWAVIAEKELETPIGWRWKEEFTDLSPPPANRGGNNNNNPPPRDDQLRMIPKKPTRAIPKL